MERDRRNELFPTADSRKLELKYHGAYLGKGIMINTWSTILTISNLTNVRFHPCLLQIKCAAVPGISDGDEREEDAQ